MFDKYEQITCSACENIFTGRKPADSIDIFCPECLSVRELPLIKEGDIIPNFIYKAIESEFRERRGENDDKN